jgi:predicted TIM-barrel fold metal-dependent hydrolase
MDAFFLARSRPNVWLDCSHALAWFAGSSLVADFAWCMDRIDERLLYGSDFPEYGLAEYRRRFEEVAALAPGLRKELAYGNIRKLVDFGEGGRP